MKKTRKSLFIVSTLFATLIMSLFLTGCDFNLSETQYLTRPDISVENNRFRIAGSYISKSTTAITIYRQNTTDTNLPIERVAILFPKADEDKGNQTYHYYDSCVLAAGKYHYYVRFTDEKGSRNRTEWSEIKQLAAGTGGAQSGDTQLAYSGTSSYKYNAEAMTLTLPADHDIVAPINSNIENISSYKPALVFQNGDVIQTFEIPGSTIASVSLKALLPQDFLYTDIVLLGIVGQYTKTNSKGTEYVAWTNLKSIKVVDATGKKLNSIKLEPEHGEAGFDYTIISDNEN